MEAPEEHLVTVKRFLRYVAGTRGWGVSRFMEAPREGDVTITRGLFCWIRK